MIEVANIYQLSQNLPSEEIFEILLSTPNILVERIISTGQVTPPGEWLVQEKDEWVILLQGIAELSYFEGSKIRLQSGDYLLIKSQQKHRVEYTSDNPPCIWLAIHLNLDQGNAIPRSSIREHA